MFQADSLNEQESFNICGANVSAVLNAILYNVSC
jgi:hypothetical protein